MDRTDCEQRAREKAVECMRRAQPLDGNDNWMPVLTAALVAFAASEVAAEREACALEAEPVVGAYAYGLRPLQNGGQR